MLGRLLIGLVMLALGFGAGLFWSQRDVASSAVGQPEGVGQEFSDSSNRVKARVPVAVTPAATNLSPLVSLAEAANIASEFDQSASLYALAGPQNAAGIEQLLEEAERELTGGDYLGASAILIGRYAELDVSAAIAYALANGGSLRARWVQSIFHARARLDVDDAVARAAQLDGNLRSAAGLAIIRSVDGLSQQERQSIAATLGVSDQLLVRTQTDPAQAWSEARNISNPTRRAQSQAGLAVQWGQSDPWAALQASEEIDSDGMRKAVQSQLIGLLAVVDTEAALNWVDAQPEGSQRDVLTAALVATLATSDLEKAQSLLAELPEGQRDKAELAIWTQRAGSDPEGAAAWFGERRNTPNSATGAIQVLMGLSMTSQESADRFMDALPATTRGRLEPTYVQMLARENPQRAATRVEQIEDSRQRTAAATSLVGNWAATDPAAAIAWVESQPADATPALYESLARNWAQDDVQSARAFADQLTAGADRDRMISGIVTSGQLDGVTAQEMSADISDVALRERTQRMVSLRQKAMEAARGGLNGFGSSN